MNGSIYIKNVAFFYINKSIKTDETSLYLMDKRYSVDIDDEEDLYIASLLYRDMIITPHNNNNNEM